MVLQNYMHIGLLLIIEKHIIFLHVMEFYLIMNHHEEEKHLSQEKFLKLLCKISQGLQNVFIWKS